MKEKSIIIICYAVLILIGGIIGHVVANSLASLISSSVIACVLFGCAALVWKGNLAAYHATIFMAACLFAFFSYRFFLTYKIAPAGIMAIISGCLVVYFVLQRKKVISSI